MASQYALQTTDEVTATTEGNGDRTLTKGIYTCTIPLQLLDSSDSVDPVLDMKNCNKSALVAWSKRFWARVYSWLSA